MNCIIIPVYYEDPNRLDKFSINSLMDNLEDINEYDIVIVSPNDINLDSWKSLLGTDAKVKTFDGSNFNSTIAYSKLLESYDFWSSFSDYEYALLYQTDGYCFGGKLSDFIEDGYDYIGAPIVAKNARWFCTPAVGNGGISLRKVSTMIETTDPDGEFIRECASDIERHNKQNGNMYAIYEDLYFAQLVPMLWEFSKASVNRAFDFSYDMNTDVVWNMTDHKLPMFCHAFDKNIRFWQNVSDAFKDVNIISDCEWKNRNGYFDPNISYQVNLQHKRILPGVIICVKKENWRLEKTIDKMIEAGFKKIIIVDNNELSGEKPVNSLTKICRDADIVFVDKFRGKRNEDGYDLISEMYSYAYEHYCNDLTHIMFLDADEELVFEDPSKTIVNIIDEMTSSGYDMMHVPVYDANQNGDIQDKTVRKKVKTLMKTDIRVVKFSRETPIIRYACCDNAYNKIEDSASSHYVKDVKSNVYIINHPTGTKQEFEAHKMFRGWPDRLYANRKKECNEDYFYMFNDKKSTISIE